MLPFSPLMLALMGTEVVPEPMSCWGVNWLPLIELLVLYWNQTWVSAPLALTEPPRVALLLVIADAEPVLTAGTGWIPVPLKATFCGLLEALSVKFSEPLRLPVADGVKVTLTAQVPLGVTVPPEQVSELLAKSLAFVPPIVTVEMVRLPVPLLVTVSICPALVVLRG